MENIKNGCYSNNISFLKVNDNGIISVEGNTVQVIKKQYYEIMKEHIFLSLKPCPESDFINAYNKAISSFNPFVNNAKAYNNEDY